MDFSEFNSSQSYFRKEDNVVVCVLDDPFYPWIRHCGFFASNQKPAGFECSKSAFLGSEEDLKRPRAVCEMKCTETSASTQACAAALQYRISLKPKEEKRLNFVVAYSRQSTPELSDRQKKYMVSQNADNALQESSQFWGSK
jgi:cellobiose phosphorylase